MSWLNGSDLLNKYKEEVGKDQNILRIYAAGFNVPLCKSVGNLSIQWSTKNKAKFLKRVEKTARKYSET